MAKIIVDPKILGGKPIIAGTRIPVYLILELLASGLTEDEIIKDYYPHLTKESIRAAARYSAQVVKGEEIHFLEQKRDKVYAAVV
jgi:uncharacterized protein (DUF433 family)